MKQFLILSGEDLKLAKEEALAIAETEKYQQDKNILIFEIKNNLQRLAFTKQIFQHLFSCNIKDLEDNIKKFDWQKIYKKNFCVRIKGKTNLKEKDLASLIWKKIKKPKVDLENPKTNIYFFITEKNVHCGLLLYENKESFQERRPHLREGFHPTSIQPKLARALVNLSKVKKGEILLDPFVGTGGILIEAGLLGCKLIGRDVSQKMIDRTKINLKKYKLKSDLKIGDALKLDLKADAVVTDLPYGKGSYHIQELNYLYREFLKKAYNLLKPNKYLVAVFPKSVKSKTKLKILKEIKIYIHSSLTRHIIIAKKTSK